MNDEYENIVAAISHVKALDKALEELERDDLEYEQMELNELHNKLNGIRLELLGNGRDRPWFVSEIVKQQ